MKKFLGFSLMILFGLSYSLPVFALGCTIGQSTLSPTSYWPENQNSSDVIASHNGTNTNISYVVGPFPSGGFAAHFNATSSKITITDTPDLYLADVGTWTFVINASSTSANNRGQIISQWGVGGYSFESEQDATSAQLSVDTAANLDASDIITTSASPVLSESWGRVWIVKDNTSLCIYKNGSQINCGTVQAVLADSGNDILFGQNGDGSGWFSGSMTDIAYFNDQAITGTQIANMEDVSSTVCGWSLPTATSTNFIETPGLAIFFERYHNAIIAIGSSFLFSGLLIGLYVGFVKPTNKKIKKHIYGRNQY